MMMEGEHEYEHEPEHSPSLPSSRDEMESLVLDEPLSASSPSTKLNGISSSEFHPLSHPLAVRIDDDLLHSKSSVVASNYNPNFESVNSYLDSPTFEDSIANSFDSVNGESNGHWNPKAVSVSAEYIRFSVSDPKEQEVLSSLVHGGNCYYTYLITRPMLWILEDQILG